jgi:hypothetical protein
MTERILTVRIFRPKSPGQPFTDNHDRLGIGRVASVKFTPAAERDAEGVEKVWRDVLLYGDLALVELQQLPVGRLNRSADPSAERRR